MPFFTLQYDRGLNFKADMRYSEFSVSCSFLKVPEMSILTHWRIDDRWGQVGTGGDRLAHVPTREMNGPMNRKEFK